MSVSLPGLMWAADITGFTESEIISALTPELEEEIMWSYNRWTERRENESKSIVPALRWAAEKTGFSAREILSALSPELEDEITRGYDRWLKRRQQGDEESGSPGTEALPPQGDQPKRKHNRKYTVRAVSNEEYWRAATGKGRG